MRTKTPKDANISLLKTSWCTIPFLVMWSHDTGADNQLSHHADKCADKVKPKWNKSTIGQQPQRIKIKAYTTPKRCKYFTAPTIKVHDTISGHVITWYRCGQSTFSSCGHVGGQRKAKMDKSTIGQQPQRIKIKADKNPKRCKYFATKNIMVHDLISGHVITWYRCGQSTFSSCGHVSIQRKEKMDKSTIGQQPQRIKIKRTKNPKRCKYFATKNIMVHDPISGHVITWYRCGQSTFSSLGHVVGQRRDKMDKSTIGQQPQRIKIKRTKTPKDANISLLKPSWSTIPFLVMWSHDTGADNQLSHHADKCADKVKPKGTKAP